MSRRLYDIGPLLPLADAGYVLLTPNARLARRIKSEWDARRAAAGAAVWEPPAVMPIERWLQQQWQRAVAAGLLPPRVVLTAAQVLELWQQVIAGEQRAAAAFRLLRPAAAAEQARSARDILGCWQVDTADPAVRERFALDVDCATFLAWNDRFEQRLERDALATAVDCARQLSTCAGALPASPLALLEFDDLPPLYRTVVDTLGSEVRQVQAGGGAGSRTLLGFADRRAELEAAACWAAARHREDPDAALGIVLSDMATERVPMEYLLRREFGCLGNDYHSLPVNFSTGIPLAQAPLVRDALDVLSLCRPKTEVATVQRLLCSRFLPLPDAGTPLANRFLRRLYEDGREVLDSADLRHAACDITQGDRHGLLLGQHLLQLAANRQIRQPALPSRWADLFGDVLEAWGWPGGGPLDSLEVQQLEVWYRTLDEYRGYDAVCRPLGLARALELLRSLCSRQVSQPRTDDSRVQVLGPLEAAGLAFDELWLCGLHASRWPAPARPHPFIPHTLQRLRQMPHATADREWRFASGLIEQYTRSAAVVYASYCRMLDDAPEQPSALLHAFVAGQSPRLPGVDPNWTRMQRQCDLEVLEEGAAPAPDAEELAVIGGGSALLEEQSRCPFRAFARRRLRVEPLPEFVVGLSRADRGSLLHSALHSVWGTITGYEQLLALDESGEAAVVAEAARAAVSAFPARRRGQLGPGFWRLEQERLSRLLREWLAVERTRVAFVVRERECDLPLTLGRLSLRLRVDRIDELADGARVIIDYKTGAAEVKDWLGQRPARPQLLLYGIAAPGSAAALAFARVQPRRSCFAGLGRVAAAPGINTDIARAVGDRMDAGDWETLNAAWREGLQRLAEQFLAGRAEVDPLDGNTCNSCGLQPLCRIDSTVPERR